VKDSIYHEYSKLIFSLKIKHYIFCIQMVEINSKLKFLPLNFPMPKKNNFPENNKIFRHQILRKKVEENVRLIFV
jgi:hypothetical protein